MFGNRPSMMKISAARLLLVLLSFAPLPVQRGLARLLAQAAWYVPWRKRAVIEGNLARAFPELGETARRRLAKDDLVSMFCTAFECGALWHRSRGWLERRIRAVEGREHVEQALARGRGVLVLGGHLGNWELSILYGSLTLPIDYLYKPPRSVEVDRLLSGYRSRFGTEMIATGGASMRRALRKLREGRALGMLFDQLPRGGDWVEAPFFGRPVATMTLPHRLIRATGCAVVMGHCLRVPGGWKIRFDPVPDADHPDPKTAAAAMNRVLENIVRAVPEQYLWQYRRFEAPLARDRRPD